MKLSLRIGALCPPLGDQLKDIIPVRMRGKYTLIGNSLVTLGIHGLVTRADEQKIMKRLMAQIQKDVTQQAKPKPKAKAAA